MNIIKNKLAKFTVVALTNICFMTQVIANDFIDHELVPVKKYVDNMHEVVEQNFINTNVSNVLVDDQEILEIDLTKLKSHKKTYGLKYYCFTPELLTWARFITGLLLAAWLLGEVDGQSTGTTNTQTSTQNTTPLTSYQLATIYLQIATLTIASCGTIGGCLYAYGVHVIRDCSPRYSTEKAIALRRFLCLMCCLCRTPESLRPYITVHDLDEIIVEPHPVPANPQGNNPQGDAPVDIVNGH